MFTPSKIQERSILDLRPQPRNTRTHSKKQIRKVAESLREFGFVNPVLIDEKSYIIAGHCRVEAAKYLGLTTVPAITLSHLSSAEVRAYVIADNKLATLAGWDREMLSIEIAELALAAPDLDLTVTGLEAEEIEILQDLAPSENEKEPADHSSDLSSVWKNRPVTVQGDLWQIGRHKLLCGDALDASAYRQLLGTDRADLVITDPPYNVPIAGHVSGLGAIRHQEFQMASGEMTRIQFQRFLAQTCENLARFSRSGSLHYIFMDWRSIGDLLSAGEQSYEELLNIIVWVKNNGGMGTLYRSQHELVALFKKGKRGHVNNIALGSNGRYRTNVWQYPGASSFGSTRTADLALHPTVKNHKMIMDAMKDVTEAGALVLDPFGGSGTTLIAAEKCRRTARLMEIDPAYCDVIIRRAAAIRVGTISRSTSSIPIMSGTAAASACAFGRRIGAISVERLPDRGWSSGSVIGLPELPAESFTRPGSRLSR